MAPPATASRARTTTPALLAGALAVLAFALAGATLGSTLPSADPAVANSDGPSFNKTSGIPNGTGGGQQGPAGEADDKLTCSRLCPGAVLSTAGREAVAGVGLLAVLGALVVAYRLTGGSAAAAIEEPAREDGLDIDEPDGTTSAPRHSLDVPVTNEVYRAWASLRDRLAGHVTDPETTTPGEYARRAREAGFDDGPVAELTDLFRRVRYRGEEPTDDLETRATEALETLATGADSTADTASDDGQEDD